MKTEQNAKARAKIVGEQVNLKKDFFSLTPREIHIINYYKNVFNFNGRNNLGRSELEQFYYHLQKGHRMNWEEKTNITNPYA